jgi:membrane protein
VAWGAALADYLRRIWHHSAEDDLLFLASGVAFGILLAALPFVLLVMSGLATLLNETPERTALSVHQLLDTLLPRHAGPSEESVHKLIDDILKSRGALGIWGAIGYFWFTSRLFGALRSALSQVLDFGTQRGVVAGKLHDFRLTVVSTLLLTGYLALTAYVAIATSRGAEFFVNLGLRSDVMSGLEYLVGRLLAFVLVVALIFLLYRFIPVRGIPSRAALAGAITASIVFELTRIAYAYLTNFLSPATIYTGTLYTVVSIVFWVYYSAIIFLLGGEVARVYEIRSANRVTV